MQELKQKRIYQLLLGKIISGAWPAGMKLPAEPELCRTLGVARGTLRVSMNRLTKEGMLQRSRPGGTVVLGTQLPRSKVLIVTPGPAFLSAENDYQRTIFAGAEERIRELDMEPIPVERAFLPEKLAHPEEYTGLIVQLSNFCGNEEVLGTIRNLHLPAVIVRGTHSDTRKTGLASIIIDTRRAWLDGLRHLVDRGHRKIIFLLMEWELVGIRMNFSKQELPGMLRSVSLDPAEQTIVLLKYGERIEEPLREVLLKIPDATALYCYSDYYAFCSYPVIRSLHRRIPDDLAVMGFSAQAGSSLMSPPLSTVDFNNRRAARLAVDLLVKIRKGERPADSVVVSPAEVLVRESTEKILF